MEAKEITRRLIKGSHAIDRMRAEVSETVKMLIGFVNNCDRRQIIIKTTREFGSDLCKWSIGHYYGQGNKLQVKCWLKEKFWESYAFSSYPNEIPFHTCNVKPVYMSLYVLVEGLLKTFPELEEYWKPLINASFVKFDV
jgi:hypothetical protein